MSPAGAFAFLITSNYNLENLRYSRGMGPNI